jgi:pantetheine-phosphate adenylyltransferase
MRAGANPKFKSPALANNAGLHQNFPEPLKNSPSCLAVYFTWPQVALTHHVLSTAIETLSLEAVNIRRRAVVPYFARLSVFATWREPIRRFRAKTQSRKGKLESRKPQLFYLPITIYHLRSESMRRAIYPGSFDPVTNGHLDIIQRGCKLFDEIIVAILINPDKRPFFSVEERKEILAEVLKDIEQGDCSVVVDSFAGLLVQYAAEKHADAIVRGIRAISDYEYELQMALMNRRLEPSLETVFMMPAEAYSYVSSRLVKEVFQLRGNVAGLVPAIVEERMRQKK